MPEDVSELQALVMDRDNLIWNLAEDVARYKEVVRELLEHHYEQADRARVKQERVIARITDAVTTGTAGGFTGRM